MEPNTIGKTTIAPSVLHTIARLTTLGIPGVSRMASSQGTVSLPSADGEGVKVKVNGSKIYLEIFIIPLSGENVRALAESIQKQVARAITEMVGMEVANIDVHIMDIDIEA